MWPPSDCYNELGSNYNGIWSQTESKEPCLLWSQRPSLVNQIDFTHNYCRNPNEQRDRPWCWTQSGWSYCTLPPCATLFSLDKKWNEFMSKIDLANLPVHIVIIMSLISLLFAILFALICLRVCCLKRRLKPLDSASKVQVVVDSIKLDSFDSMMDRLRQYEINSGALNFIRDIGQGEFGRVVQAKILKKDLYQNVAATRSLADMEANVDELDAEDEYKIVAVKMLKPTANRALIEQSMVREAYIMSMLSNTNLLGLVAVCDPATHQMCMLVDYMAKGDLNSFLRFRSPYTNSANRPKEGEDISLPTMLLGFAVQIANGMEYMSARSLVHRDLATRNCLIDENLTVKISDFGMAQTINTTPKANELKGRMLHKNLKRAGTADVLDSEEQQTLLQNEKLPIRWMPLEASLFQTFTVASDVWAFGVLIWELFTFAAFPYADITHNKEVIKYLLSGKRLAYPEMCPQSVRIILNDCWQVDPNNRPSFSQLKLKLHEAKQDINRPEKKRWFFFC